MFYEQLMQSLNTGVTERDVKYLSIKYWGIQNAKRLQRIKIQLYALQYLKRGLQWWFEVQRTQRIKKYWNESIGTNLYLF